jgi:chemotaxis signal transduction protein
VREARQRPRLPPAAREDVIMFTVGGFTFAIAAGAIKEIRGTEGLHAFSPAGLAVQIDKLKYTLERDGATYFVVDAARHFHLNTSAGTRVLILRDSTTAVLVDSTDRMMEISALHALPRAFTHEERLWYRGLAVINDEVVPVVNPNSFLTQGEQEVLRAGLERLRRVARA